jgi:hypothetical protein
MGYVRLIKLSTVVGMVYILSVGPVTTLTHLVVIPDYTLGPL